MPRIALISPLEESVPPRLYGGTERVIHNLARGLTQAGCEVTLFASGDSLTQAEVIPIVSESFRLSSRRIEQPAAYYHRMLSMVAARARDFDVIHNHHDFWMLPLSNMTDVPLLTTMHGRMDMPDLSAAYRAYPRAAHVSISDSQRAPLPDLKWVQTIHHGIDLAGLEFHPHPGKYLAFLGRVCPEKGPHRAIQIAKMAGIPLKIAAKIEGPQSQEYFDAEIRPHLDGRNVEFIGEIGESEKSDFLGEALGLVFPIDWPEPFGLVMVESLACGTPVLARPRGSVPEILAEGVTGFVHERESVLARRARELESFDREGCRRYVEQRFSIQRMTEDYIDVYGRLAEAGISRLSPGRRRDLLHSVKRTAL